jgi:hypothetical protein
MNPLLRNVCPMNQQGSCPLLPKFADAQNMRKGMIQSELTVKLDAAKDSSLRSE